MPAGTAPRDSSVANAEAPLGHRRVINAVVRRRRRRAVESRLLQQRNVAATRDRFSGEAEVLAGVGMPVPASVHVFDSDQVVGVKDQKYCSGREGPRG
jgi:hypothetical protein